MDFLGIDLNLLAAFDALANELNVTRAAARMGVTQPAMSAALSRLRTLFNDPLFYRNSQGLLPTPKARDLAEPIARGLKQMEAAIRPKVDFEPSTATQIFTLGLSDYPSYVLLPGLANAMERLGHGLSISVLAIGHRDSAVDLLDAGLIDAAVGFPPTQAESRIISRRIMRDRYVTIVRRDHPVTKRGMDLQTFLSLRHVLASPEGQRFGYVDQALGYQDQTRLLSLTLPQMFAIPQIIANTNMTATIMRRVVENSIDRNNLALFTPPVKLPEIGYDLMWHRRNDNHLTQQWFREQIAALVGQDKTDRESAYS